MGRLDNNKATPEEQPDSMAGAVPNKSRPERQTNAHDLPTSDHGLEAEDPARDDARSLPANNASPTPTRNQQQQQGLQQQGQRVNNPDPRPKPEQPDHSMKEEIPLGWDQVPTDIHDPRQQRHPHTEGKGGTPDEGEARVAKPHRVRPGEGPLP
ncbi:MAG TPA: hypothetical protein VK324_00810 [Tepidisphaeraceae bacterium]|nr:hypothetical protein [Tepidisphaeraceae bacterium]